ncbi:MAG: tRNA (adenosine(37)-N6)-threonylcarbamoyltransferase complex dimerization subunit type 1 TsaB [Bacilli bacterium]|nr:tRNA (adenosine(37)-N6)-threonylcarbamoyltransferase complex dimerization subunit type 1 TsaB [Bacilli bacterium]
MTSLFIDTSTKFITLSIIKDNKQCYFFHEKVFEELSVKILPLISDALKQCNLKAHDINKIYIVTGPGSFTGIRIGLTIFKVIAWTLKIDIVPISSLELIASTKTDTDYIVPCIDARRGNCYIAIYNENLDMIVSDRFTSFQSFIDDILLDKTFQIVTYDDIDNGNKIVPQIDIIKVINKHKNDLPINPHMINPNYLKKTEAEENFERKNN